jgi:hypothetical protein
MTPEQIKTSVESIVSKQKIFTEIVADGFVDDQEKEKLNIALGEIKTEIGTITQHPEELKLFIEEAKQQVVDK